MIISGYTKQTLQDYFQVMKKELKNVIEIAISITEELAAIHSNNIIHRDINPVNIIIDPLCKRAFIKTSPLSMKTTNGHISNDNPETIEGDPHYISPEQTGLVDLQLDYRSDLYSLGAVLYEMLTGKTPFQSQDITTLIHKHIAVKPRSPHELNPNIPEVFADIILKLLFKLPHERYQSVFGLLVDLKKCFKQLKQQGKLETFSLGVKDISPIFKIKAKLYARNEEIAILKTELENVKNGQTRILFISGAPGIGKSFLVKKMQNQFIKADAHFISGKFDQYKRDIPYSALIEAFQDLIRQLLTKSETELNLWKRKILNCLDINGEIITDIIPDLQLIIGKQKPVEELSTDKTRTRFNYVFQNFMKVFASETYPLIFFLDDLHWADSASLELLNLVLSDKKLSAMLFIGAYRNMEAEINPPLIKIIEKLQQQNQNYQAIRLKPVAEDYISSILKDILAKDFSFTDPFVHLILDKTSGNPLFIKEFLIDLYKNGFITFHSHGKDRFDSEKHSEWQIDMAGITNATVPDSVVDILTGRVASLHGNTIKMLKLASCIGVEFSLITLSKINGKFEVELAESIKEAINEGIILEEKDKFKFIHDKVQEVVYDLINPKEKEKIHYSIATFLLNKDRDSKTNKEIFNIVQQLNLAKRLLNNEERNNLIELNLKAGQRARTSTAYNAAINFLKNGLTMLADDSWELNYETTLSYHIEILRAEYLLGNYDEVEALFKVIFPKTKSTHDRLKIYEFKIDYYAGRMKLNEIFSTVKKAFKESGFSLPERISKTTVLKEKMKIMLQLRKRDIGSLLYLPTINDPKIINLINIIVKSADAAYTADPYLFAFLTIKGVHISLRHGNCTGTAYFYSGLAALFCQPGIFNDIDKGHELSQFALQLNNKYYSRTVHARVLFVNTNVCHWKEPLKKNLQSYQQVIDLCLNNGDEQLLSFSYLYYTSNYLLMTKTLKETYNLVNEYTNHIQKFQQSQFNSYFSLVKQNHNNCHDVCRDRSFLVSFYISKSIVFYLYGKYKKGIEINKNKTVFLEGLSSSPIIPIYYYFYALHLSADYVTTKHKRDKITAYFKLLSIQKKFQKWGRHNQSAYYQMYLLISAEMAMIKKQHANAANLYKQAIASAKENGFLYCEAIANECAGKFYLRNKKLNEAGQFIKEAYEVYKAWGAKSKLKIIKKYYAGFFPEKNDYGDNIIEPDTNIQTESQPCSHSLANLDLESISEGADLVANMNDINKSLKTLLAILIRKTGAERSILLLEKNDALYIRAQCNNNNGEITKIHNSALQKNHLPESIIRFVKRTRETVLISDAVTHKLFMNDPYILKKRPQSLLCMPLILQTRLIGILYLEQSRFKNLFSHQRHKILKPLVNQISILMDISQHKNRLRDNKKNKNAAISMLIEVLKDDFNMTAQEIKIALLFKEGLSRDDIGGRLNISYNTIRGYLKSIYNKTINDADMNFGKVGRVDKLSKLISFLNKLENDL